MDITAVYATLLGEPYWLSIDQIRQLTDKQIRLLYLRKRDEEGRVIPIERDDPEPLTPEQEDAQLFALGKVFGIPLDKLQKAQRQKRGKQDAAKDAAESGRNVARRPPEASGDVPEGSR